jgi:predicted helicase
VGIETGMQDAVFYPHFSPLSRKVFIKLFTEEGETVLDPMCGCGTTLVEALLHNRNAIALISKVKTTLISDL